VFKDNTDNSLLDITNVYGSHSARDRQVLWQELRDFRHSFVGLWYVAVDFNLTRFMTEHKGLTTHEKDFEEFSDIVKEFEWKDLLCGGQFTWSNKRSVLSFAKLDRFFISFKRDDKRPYTIQNGLASQLFDYSQILLKSGAQSSAKKVFRFEKSMAA